LQIQLEKSGIGLRGTPRCVGGGKISGAEVCLSSGGVEPHNVDALWLANESPSQCERTTPSPVFPLEAADLCAERVNYVRVHWEVVPKAVSVEVVLCGEHRASVAFS